MEYNLKKPTASGRLSSLSIYSVDHFHKPSALLLTAVEQLDVYQMFVKMTCSVSYTKTDNGYTPCDQTYDSSAAPPYDTFVSPITEEAFNRLGAKCESKRHCCVLPDGECFLIILVA